MFTSTTTPYRPGSRSFAVTTRRTVVSVVIAITAVSCSGGGPSLSSEPHHEAIEAVTTSDLDLRPEEFANRLGAAFEQCVAEFGFVVHSEHLPKRRSLLLPDAQGLDFYDPKTGESVSEREYVERFGVGIAATFEARRGAIFEVGPPERANREYRRALASNDRAVYQRALYGESTPESQGCQGRADRRLAAFSVVAEPADGESAFDEVERLVLSQEQIAAALAGWRNCMSGYGYGYQDPESAADEFDRRFAQTLRSAKAEEVLDVVEVLRRDEIEFAIANLDCGGGAEELGAAFTAAFEAEWNRRFPDDTPQAGG